MAYSFDGVNDKVVFGTDSSIDGFTQQTVCAWVVNNAANALRCILAKDRNTSAWELIITAENYISFRRMWTAIGSWSGGPLLSASTLYHLAVTYDGASASNDPTFYVNGTAHTASETSTPSGSLLSDATPPLQAGLRGDNGADHNGLISAIIYDNAIWSAADINRAKWWGTRGGSVKVVQPFLTDAVNRGTATAPGTATGAVLASLPRVERCWGNSMGVGR